VRRVPRLTSRHRITARIVLVLIAVWCIAGVALVTIVQQKLVAQLDQDLQEDAPGAAAVLDQLAPDALAEQPAESRLAIAGALDADALLVLGPDGSVTAIPSVSSDRTDPLPDLGDRTLAELRGAAGRAFMAGDQAGHDGQYRVVAAPLRTGGVLLSARSLDTVDRFMRVLGQMLLVSFLVSVGVVVVLVWLIGRQTLRPLEDVIGTAQEISAGTLATRVVVPTTSAPDVERLADSMNNMLARLEEAFAVKNASEARMRQFIGDASHELRTPLAAVLGYAELYQEHMARSPEQIDKAMSRIIAEGTRMQSLVEDLLLLARIDEGRPLARGAVDLGRVIDESVSAMRVIDRDHEFVLRCAADVEVCGDRLALRQVVDNLLGNVVAHTPPGTITSVSLGTDAGNAVVTIADDGPGMSQEERAHAFDRFWRADRGRARPGGAGLGLAIVAGLVRAQGGSLDLVTAPGHGATFTIRLPRWTAPVPG